MKISRFAVLIPALVAACTPAEQTAEDTARAQVAPDTVQRPAAPADTAAARTVHVVLNEWTVRPAQSTLAPGRVTFHVMNEGRQQHALEVERGNDEWQTGRIPAGGTATLTVDLTPGTYTLYCPVVEGQVNHRQRGMQTTVTVR